MPGVAGSQPTDVAPITPAMAPPVPLAPLKAAPQGNADPTPAAPAPQGSPAPAPTQDPLDALAQQHNAEQAQPSNDDPLDALAKQHNADADAGWADKAEKYLGDHWDALKDEFKKDPQGTLAKISHTLADNAGNTLAFGYLPQISGAAGALKGAVGMDDSYLQSRDATVNRMQQENQDNPVTATVGKGLGMVGQVAGAAVTGGASALPTAFGDAAIAGAKIGAVYGGLSNPGDTQGQIAPVQLGDRLKNALIGAPFGAAMGVGGYGAVKGVGALKGIVDDFIQPYLDSAKNASDFVNSVKANPDILPEQRLLSNVSTVNAVNESAKRAGLPLYAHEVVEDPHAQALIEGAIHSPKFQQEQVGRGQLAANLVEDIGNSFNVDPDATLGSIVKAGSVKDRYFATKLRGARNALINDSESPVMVPQTQEPEQLSFTQQTPSEPQQTSFVQAPTKTIGMTNLQQTVNDLQTQFGFAEGNPPTGAALAALEQKLNLQNSPGKTSELVRQVTSLSQKLEDGQGRMLPRDADKLYTDFKDFTDNHYDPAAGKQSQAFMTFMKIKDGLRDDFINGIGALQGPEAKANYQSLMQGYHEVATAADQLGPIFDSDSPAPSAILSYIQSKGLAGLDRMQALKTVVDYEHPGSWDTVGKAVYDKLLNDNHMPGNARLANTNWARVNKAINSNSVSAQQYEIAMGSDRFAGLQDIATAMEAVQRNQTDIPPAANTVVKVLKAFGAIIRNGDTEAAQHIILSDHAAATLMNADTTAKYIARFGERTQAGLNQLQATANKALRQR